MLQRAFQFSYLQHGRNARGTLFYIVITALQITYLASCSKGSKIISLKKSMVDVDVKTSTDPAGATSGSVEKGAVVNQRVNAQDGVSATFQPSSLEQSVIVKISKVSSIAIPEFATALSLGGFSTSGQAVQITSVPQIDLLKTMRLNLTAPSDSSTQKQWVVIYESPRAKESGSYYSGVIPHDKLSINGNFVQIDVSYFGTYQVVAVEKLPAALGELKGTVQQIAAQQGPASATTVLSLSSPAADSLYSAGNVIDIHVTFNRSVTVTGTSTLSLNSGGTATYTSGSGTTTLTYSYTVAASDNSTDLDASGSSALTTSGSVNDVYGRSAYLSVPVGSASGSLASSKNLIVQGNSPRVLSVSSTMADATYIAGNTIGISVNFSTSVAVTGTPRITLATGGAGTVVNYSGGTGSTTLNFNYTVAAGENATRLDYTTLNALDLNGGKIKDSSTNVDASVVLPSPGNASSLSGMKNIVIDTAGPAVTSFVKAAAQPLVTLNPAIKYTITFSEAIASPSISPADFTNAGTATGVAFTVTTSDNVTFNIGMSGGTDGTYIPRLAASSVTDVAGNANSNSFTATDTVTLDRAAPTLTFSSTSPTSPSTSRLPVISGTASETSNVTIYSDASCSTAISATSADTSFPSPGIALTTQLAANTSNIIYAKAVDTAGNPSTCTNLTTYVHDSNVPNVTNVSATTADGSYKTGASIDVTVTFSETVVVTGNPKITLATGGAGTAVTYTSGSGTSTLTFRYTVAAGENSADLDYLATSSLSLHGGTINDNAGNSANLTLPVVGSGSSIAGQKAIIIDTTAPTATYVSISPATVGTSQTPTVVMTISEVSGANGARLYSDSGCSTAISPAFTAASGSNSVTTTTLMANTVTTVYIKTNDLAGNVSACASMISYTHDNVAPSVNSFSRAGSQPSSTNSLPVNFTLVFSEAIDAATLTASDISQTGTATGVTWSVTDSGDHTSFTIAATASGNGTLQPRLAGSAVTDPAGNSSSATAQSSNNSVTYNGSPLTVTINQAGGQADPTNAAAISFTAVFSAAVNVGTGSGGFDASDISNAGTATATFATSSLDNVTWTIIATVATEGTVIPTIAANKLQDTSGNNNAASTSTDNTVTYDITAPTLTFNSFPTGNPGTALMPSVQGTGSEPSTVTLYYDSACATAKSAGAANTVFASPGITVNSNVNSNSTTTIYGKASDLAGNLSLCTLLDTYTHDSNGPAVTTVSSTNSDGSYNAGTLIPVKVTFGEAAIVTGTPQLALSSGGTADYASGSGTTTLTFNYTIAASQNAADLDYSSTTALTLNGGTIKDSLGNNATLTLPATGSANSLAGQKNIAVDTTNPALTYVSISPVSPSSTTTPSVTLTPSEASMTNGLRLYSDSSCGSAISAATTVSPVNTAITTGTLPAGSTTIYGQMTDLAGNQSTCTPLTTYVVDLTRPVISSVSSTTADGKYGANSIIAVTVNFSKVVTVTGTPKLTLETGTVDAIVSYTSGSGSSTLRFDYTVAASDSSADLNYTSVLALELNGGTIKDSATNNADITLPVLGSGNDLAGQKALIVDTAGPVITFGSTSPTSPNASTTPSVTFALNEATITNGLRLYSDASCNTAISATATGVSGNNTVTTTALPVNTATSIYAKATDTAATTANTSCVLLTTYNNDSNAPSIVSFTKHASQAINDYDGSLQYTVQFSEAMLLSSFTSSDITNAISHAGTVTWTATSSDNITWTLTGSYTEANGEFRPQLANGAVTDLAGNPVVAAVSPDAVFFKRNVVSTASAIGDPSQRKTYYDGTNHWVFYNKGATIEFASASSPSAFANYAIQGVLPYPTTDFTVVGSGSTVILITVKPPFDVITLKGTISGLNISWAAELTVFPGASTNPYNKVAATVDSSGQLFILASSPKGVDYVRGGPISGNFEYTTPSPVDPQNHAPARNMALVERTGGVVYAMINTGQVAGYNFSAGSWTKDNIGGAGFRGLGASADGGDVLVTAVAGSYIYAGGNFNWRGSLCVNICRYDTGTSQWQSMQSGANGKVYAIVPDTGGNLYVGGNFTAIGGIAARNIAKWNATTQQWTQLGAGTSGTVYAIALNPMYGKIFAGGNFASAGSVNASSVAQWDGSSWTSLGIGLTAGGSPADVNAMVTDSSGRLYVVGAFTSAGGNASGGIAKWDGMSWTTLGTGTTTGAIYTVAVNSAGTTVYAGGSFTQIAGSTISYIAQWSGSAWSAMGSAPTCIPPPDGTCTPGVYALAVDGSNNLFAGGNFISIGGTAAKYVAKYNGTWTAMGSGLSSWVWWLTPDSFGNVIAGGTFTNTLTGLNKIAKFSSSVWTTVGTIGGDAKINVAVFDPANGDVYVGGRFSSIGGLAISNLAKWDTTTNDWSAVGSNAPDNEVNTLAFDANGNLYAGGTFVNIGGVVANRIARYNVDSNTWSAMGSGFDAFVQQIIWESNTGKIYAGGAFQCPGGMTWSGSYPDTIKCGDNASNFMGRIAMWDGNTWSQMQTGANAEVYAVAADGAGKIYIGGNFLFVGSTPASYTAVWNGSAWSAMGSGTNQKIYAITAKSASEIYYGGRFTDAGGITANYIAKWNGSAWSALGSGLNSNVYGLTNDGTNVYVGGGFTTAGGNNYPYLAKWSGSAWGPLAPSTSESYIWNLHYSPTYGLAMTAPIAKAFAGVHSPHVSVFGGQNYITSRTDYISAVADASGNVFMSASNGIYTPSGNVNFFSRGTSSWTSSQIVSNKPVSAGTLSVNGSGNVVLWYASRDAMPATFNTQTYSAGSWGPQSTLGTGINGAGGLLGSGIQSLGVCVDEKIGGGTFKILFNGWNYGDGYLGYMSQ